MGVQKERRPLLKAVSGRNIGPVDLPVHTVANAPDPTLHLGRTIFVSNGAGGSPTSAVSDGTDWLRSDTNAAIAAI